MHFFKYTRKKLSMRILHAQVFTTASENVPKKILETALTIYQKKIFSNSTFHKPLYACTNTFAISYIYKTEHHFTELNKSIKN